MPTGLYIHVPFCIKKCSYCDFISYPYDGGVAEYYVQALEKEMAFYAGRLSGEQKLLKSIYVGGGTPSCLPVELLGRIFQGCNKYFNLLPGAEVTVECNPGTVSRDKFALLKNCGVNRISMGIQSYQQNLLLKLGRIHDWQDVLRAVDLCRQVGINNLSMDLIFGIPGQTMENWEESLEMVCDLMPQHVSAYNLKLEPSTVLYDQVTSGALLPCDENLELDMFWFAIDFLRSRGFQHYEISNFAQPGRASQHNLIYWQNEDYLGLGPAAHSMMNKIRFSNVESVELYISRLKNGESVVEESHCLTTEEHISETVFLGLRLIQGLNLEEFENKFGQKLTTLFEKELKKLLSLELVKIEGKYLRLTNKGLPLANEVFAEFV